MKEHESGHRDTEEHRRLVQARTRAAAEGNPWRVLLDRLYIRFPRGIHNASLHLPTGEWDAGYAGWLELPPRGWYEAHHKVGFLISFLVPHYVVYSASTVVAPTTDSPGRAQEIRFTFTPEEEPCVRAITEEIQLTFSGYRPMPPEIGNIVVPDVEAGSKHLGEATLFHCLFTDVW